VTVQINPQVPAHFIALPCPVSHLLGQSYEKALTELGSCCRTVIHGLATLGISCMRLDNKGLLERDDLYPQHDRHNPHSS
jgi:hypothetical protein